jgi:hypothetical protein
MRIRHPERHRHRLTVTFIERHIHEVKTPLPTG